MGFSLDFFTGLEKQIAQTHGQNAKGQHRQKSECEIHGTDPLDNSGGLPGPLDWLSNRIRTDYSARDPLYMISWGSTSLPLPS